MHGTVLLLLLSLYVVSGEDSRQQACNFTQDLRVHSRADAMSGYTLLAPMHTSSAVLLDMDGAVVHKWALETTTAGKAFLQEDGLLLRLHCAPDTGGGGVARGPCANVPAGGGVGGGIERVRWDGSVEWSYASNCTHHDVVPMPAGRVLVACADWRSEAEVSAAGRVNASAMIFASLLEIEPTGPTSGRVVWRWSLFEHLVQA